MDKNIFFMFLSIDVLFLSIDISFFVQLVRVCLEDSTERSESNPGRSLGIPNTK